MSRRLWYNFRTCFWPWNVMYPWKQWPFFSLSHRKSISWIIDTKAKVKFHESYNLEQKIDCRVLLLNLQFYVPTEKTTVLFSLSHRKVPISSSNPSKMHFIYNLEFTKNSDIILEVFNEKTLLFGTKSMDIQKISNIKYFFSRGWFYIFLSMW